MPSVFASRLARGAFMYDRDRKHVVWERRPVKALERVMKSKEEIEEAEAKTGRWPANVYRHLPWAALEFGSTAEWPKPAKEPSAY
jgi:hypothetical protein